MERREFEELSAGHALHALDHADESAYAHELGAHPEWDDIARRDEDTVVALADGLGEMIPPAGLRSALLDRIRHEDADPDDVDDALPALLGVASGAAGPLPIMQTRVLSSSMAVDVALVSLGVVEEEKEAAAMDVVAKPRKLRALKRRDLSLFGV